MREKRILKKKKDEDGFEMVVNTRSAAAPSFQYAKTTEHLRRKPELKNFYRFQMREQKREGIYSYHTFNIMISRND